MKKKIVFAVTAVFLFAYVLIGCGGGNPTTLSGVYVDMARSNDFYSLAFDPDGTYNSSDANHYGEYSIDGNRIWLQGVLDRPKTYYFKVDGNKLVLSRNKDYSEADVYFLQ